jgi:(p)ppGpp synthase/HD superfamily hydrolase
MPTMSFSVDDVDRRTIARLAKRSKKSQSEVLRDLLKKVRFEEGLRKIQASMEPTFRTLGLETEEDIYEYLESKETYEERKVKMAAERARANV